LGFVPGGPVAQAGGAKAAGWRLKNVLSQPFFWQSALSGIKSTMLPNLVLPEALKHTTVEPEEGH
jgi:hypothetical protein